MEPWLLGRFERRVRIGDNAKNPPLNLRPICGTPKQHSSAVRRFLTAKRKEVGQYSLRSIQVETLQLIDLDATLRRLPLPNTQKTLSYTKLPRELTDGICGSVATPILGSV